MLIPSLNLGEGTVGISGRTECVLNANYLYVVAYHCS